MFPPTIYVAPNGFFGKIYIVFSVNFTHLQCFRICICVLCNSHFWYCAVGSFLVPAWPLWDHLNLPPKFFTNTAPCNRLRSVLPTPNVPCFLFNPLLLRVSSASTANDQPRSPFIKRNVCCDVYYRT